MECFDAALLASASKQADDLLPTSTFSQAARMVLPEYALERTFVTLGFLPCSLTSTLRL